MPPVDDILAIQNLAEIFRAQRQVRQHPMTRMGVMGEGPHDDEPVPLEVAGPEVAIFPLGDQDSDWEKFHVACTHRRSDNLKPWYRCLSVLRGLNAQTAIVEGHYVCLDWRSEVAAFHVSLDAARRNYTTRVHFFGERVEIDDVVDLSPSQRRSYLGYIVMREGDLPLVGRTVLALPQYMRRPGSLSTAIDEHVHFFGQDLWVRGVPFMQQDSRFAVCAHLVAWMAHYSAYRRGIAERRLIADFVQSSAGIVPMKPSMREGLLLSQVVNLFRTMGLRSIEYTTPYGGNGPSLPQMSPSDYPRLTTELAQLLGWLDDELPKNLVAKVTQAYHLQAELDANSIFDPNTPVVRALDLLLGTLLHPYLLSRIPAYLGTTDHAVLLCGSSMRNGRPIHFVNDDQLGPYLAADSLTAMSRGALLWQTGFYKELNNPQEYERVPIRDRNLDHTRRKLPRPTRPGWSHLIVSILIPTPSRAVLECQGAVSRTATIIRDVNEYSIQGSSSPIGLEQVSAQIMMGVDYKRFRRAEAVKASDEGAIAAFSSVHLAEWVVVVQGGTGPQNQEVPWELVFDGSSSTSSPLLHCARVGKRFVAVNPRNPRAFSAALLQGERLSLIPVSQTVGKYMTTQGPKPGDGPV